MTDITPHILVIALLALSCAEGVHGKYKLNTNAPGYEERFKEQAAVVDGILDALREQGESSETGSLLITPTCEADLQTFSDALSNGELWASAMQGSWGVPNSLFMQGDNFWEGSFDTCDEYKLIWEQTGEEGLPARFCTVEWYSDIYTQGEYEVDGIGMCLPQSCTSQDFNEFVYGGAMNYTLNVPMGFPRYYQQGIIVYCTQTKEEQHNQLRNDPSAIACLCVLGIFLILGIIGTMYDVVIICKTDTSNEMKIRAEKSAHHNGGYVDSKGKQRGEAGANCATDSSGGAAVHSKPGTIGKLLMAFSVRKNAKAVLNFQHPRGSIECLNGIRFLTMAWIVLGHVYELGVYVAGNRANVGAKARLDVLQGTADYQTIKQQNLAVETFFLLSSMLTAVSFLKKLERQKPDCQMMGLYYFHRFWRLTPVYMLILMFIGCMYPYLWRGPFYTPHPVAVDCKKVWWQHLLYVNNLVPNGWNEPYCAGWTWYMANDFQFYVFAPAILFPLFYLAPLGISLGVLCGIGGLIARGVIQHKLFGEGADIDYYHDVYTRPWTRCTTYFIGLLFGYTMHKLNFKVRLHPALVVLGWMFGIALVSCAVFLPQTQPSWTSFRDYVAWETLQRPMFTFGVCWIIFACSTGHGGFLNDILSWQGWLPWARLSYVGYLIHPFLCMWHAYISPNQIYPTHWEFIFWYLGIMMLTMGASIVVSVGIEAPFAALEKVMFADIPKPKPRTYGRQKETSRSECVETGPPDQINVTSF